MSSVVLHVLASLTARTVPFLPNTPSMNPTNFETNSPISLLGSSLLVRATEGRTLHAFGHAVVVPLDGKQTGEKFTAFSISVRRAAARGCITTNEKLNGSISSKAMLVF
jgi:hypothetical protein